MRVLWFVLLFLLPLSLLSAQEAESDGDKKIEDTIKKIEEEEAEVEEPAEEEEDEEDGSGFLGELFWAIFSELFGEYFRSVRFFPYPYADPFDYRFGTMSYLNPAYNKFVSLQTSADLSGHFDGTYGNINRLTVQLSALHFNLFNQTLFSSSSSLSSWSVNGGLSLLLGNFAFSAFAGVYTVTTTGTVMGCLGFGTLLFFPARLYLDLYNLNAWLNDSFQFVHLATSLNLALRRFSVGAGYNYSRIVGTVFAGPCLKVSVWL